MPALHDPAPRRGRIAPTLAVLSSLIAVSAAAGQELRPAPLPVGVQMIFAAEAYPVGGRDAREILESLGAEGPGSRWVRFPYTYRWTYRTANVPMINGRPSDRCRLTQFDIELTLTATYPRWTPPVGADQELVAAWDAFTADLEAYWDQFQRDAAGRAREAVSAVRRFEESCAFIRQRIQETVQEAFSRPDPRTADEPRVRLVWPPDEYRHLLNPTVADVSAEAPTPTPNPAPAPAPAPEDVAPREETRPPDEASTPVVRTVGSIDLAVRLDLGVGRGGGATGFVIGLHHLGEPQFHEAFGTRAPDAEDPMVPEEPFAFPSFTEVLVATLARGLGVAGIVDLDAPIRTWLPDLSPGLGSVTLDQLLSHTAGLDNTRAPDSTAWSEVMARLKDNALFTAPGAIFSPSRYSYPLAVQALEAATGNPVEDVIREGLIGPLGLASTRLGSRTDPEARDGLPATWTTVADLTRFWTAWLAGGLAGGGPSSPVPATVPGPRADRRTFLDGYWYEQIGDVPRLSLFCGASLTGFSGGFQVYPQTRTILAFGARYDSDSEDAELTPPSSGRWPKESVRFVLSRMSEALQLGDDVFRPVVFDGGGAPATAPRRCAEPALSEVRVRDFGTVVPSADWTGRYVNGEWFFDLLDRDGNLASPIDPERPPLLVRHYGGDVYFADMELVNGPPAGFPFRLVRDAAGRRYVLLGERAYLHLEDRPGN